MIQRLTIAAVLAYALFSVPGTAQTGPMLLQGTQKVVVTANGCTSTATLTAQYFSAYPGIINKWSDVVDQGWSSGRLNGTIAYSIPCKNLSSNALAIGGDWSYNEQAGFTISWFFPTDGSNLPVQFTFSPGGGFPPTFPYIPVKASANDVTGSYTDSTFNITLNLTTQSGPGTTGPAITNLSPPSATAGGPSFTLTVDGGNFSSGAVVRWNGKALPTTFVNSTRLTASVSAALIANAGTASINVLSGGQVTAAVSFSINTASGGSFRFSNQVVTSQAPSGSGCTRPPASTSFLTTDGTVYLYFEATVSNSDSLTSDWLAPDGSVVQGTQWNGASGNYCFGTIGLPIANLPAGLLGAWKARVYNRGNVAFSVSFKVSAPVSPVSFANQVVTSQAPSGSGCTRPPASTSFLTTDGTVYLYFEATVTNSDSLSNDWVAPDGSVVQGRTWNPTSGNHCFFGSALAISNLSANRLGSWQARVLDHGNLLFSIPFSVGAPPSSVPFGNQVVTAQAPNACVAPPARTSFYTTAGPIYLYFEASVTDSDSLSNDWVAPDGSVLQSGTWNAASGDYCFYTTGLPLANLPASRLGAWQARVFDRGTLLFSITFTVSAPTPGTGTASPGDIVTINGTFRTDATTTWVNFGLPDGKQMHVIPVSVTPTAVTVVVPPYLDPKQGTITSGSYSVTVIQTPAGSSSSATQNITVTDLPQVGSPPGTITLDFLNQLSALIGQTSQTWSRIGHLSNGLVGTDRLQLAALQNLINTRRDQIQAMLNGQLSRINVTQLSGRQVYLDLNSLATMDRVLYAQVSPRQSAADAAAEFHRWFGNLITKTMPADIRAEGDKLRSRVSGIIALATVGAVVIGALPLETAVVTGSVLGAVAWSAISMATTAEIFALEGGGSAIVDERPADVNTFKSTIGAMFDATWDAAQDSFLSAWAEASGASLEYQVAIDVNAIDGEMHLSDPNSVASQTVQTAPNLSNTGTGAADLSGVWNGSYSITDKRCGTSSGQMTLTLVRAHSWSDFYNAAAVVKGLNLYDFNCNIVGTSDGVMDMTTGAFNIDLSGHLSAGYLDLGFSNGSVRSYWFDAELVGSPDGRPTLKGTLGGAGTYSDGSGTFLLSR